MKILFAPAMLVALVLGCAFPVQAEDPAPQSLLDAAGELLDVMGAEKSMAMFAGVMIDAMIQQNPEIEPLRDVFSTWMDSIFDWKILRPRYVAIYAASFSEAELRELIAFYRTPTGSKALTLMPELAQRGAEIGNEMVMEHSQELEQLIAERMTEIENEAMSKP